jgi:hypothetical protein
MLLQLINYVMIKLISIPALKGKNPKCLRFTCICISSIKVFFFQLATGAIERAVYKKRIAPFKKDLPATYIDGYRRVCADHNYAFFGSKSSARELLSIPCQIVPLPEPTYTLQLAFIISKNSSYKGLINWR